MRISPSDCVVKEMGQQMIDFWKYDFSEEDKIRTFIKTWNAYGFMGLGQGVGNAYILKARYHFNGSGPQFFGGAEKWPAVTLEVAFQVGEEERANLFAEQLKKLVEEYFTV